MNGTHKYLVTYMNNAFPVKTQVIFNTEMCVTEQGHTINHYKWSANEKYVLPEEGCCFFLL